MEPLESFEENQKNQLEEILLNTQEQCQMVEHLIKNQIEVKDQMIDKLHKELEFYKQDYADKFTDQLMKEVIKVVLLDELKTEWMAYEEPLKELRDSL